MRVQGVAAVLVVGGRRVEGGVYIWADMKEPLITADSCNEEELGRPIVPFATVLRLCLQIPPFHSLLLLTKPKGVCGAVFSERTSSSCDGFSSPVSNELRCCISTRLNIYWEPLGETKKKRKNQFQFFRSFYFDVSPRRRRRFIPLLMKAEDGALYLWTLWQVQIFSVVIKVAAITVLKTLADARPGIYVVLWWEATAEWMWNHVSDGSLW